MRLYGGVATSTASGNPAGSSRSTTRSHPPIPAAVLSFGIGTTRNAQPSPNAIFHSCPALTSPFSTTFPHVSASGVSAALPRLMLVPAQIATIASARATVFVLLNLRAILSTGPRLLPSTSALNRRPARLPTNPFDVVTSEGDTNFLDFVLLLQLVRLKLSYSDLVREKTASKL